MFQIDNDTAASAKPTKAAAGTPGWYQHGDPATGVLATRLDPDWLNAVQDEIGGCIEAVGETLDKTDDAQLYDAIFRAIRYAPHHVPIGPGAAHTYSNVAEYYAFGRRGWTQLSAGSVCSLEAAWLAPIGRTPYKLSMLAVRMRYKLVSSGATMTVRLVKYDASGTATVLAEDTYSGDASGSLFDYFPLVATGAVMSDGHSYALEIDASWADDPDDFVEIAGARFELEHE